MILPSIERHKLTERELNSYYFTRWTGGAGRAIIAADNTYKYVDIYNDDEVDFSYIKDQYVKIHDDATFTINKNFINRSSIDISGGATLLINKSFNNYGTINVLGTGKIIIHESFNNFGTLNMSDDAELIIYGDLNNYSIINFSSLSKIYFKEGRLVLFQEWQIYGSGLVYNNLNEISRLDDFIYKSIKKYVLLEGITDSILEQINLKKDGTFSIQDGYGKILYKEEIMKLGTFTESLISIIGYSVFQLYSVSINLDEYFSYTICKLNKKEYNVIFTELLEDDYSSGPNSGSVNQTTISVKFFDSPQFNINTYNGFTYLGIKKALEDQSYINLNETNITEDTNFYILYDIIEYTVNYVLNGFIGAALTSYTILSGLILQNIESEHFGGWYTDSLFTIKKENINVGEIGNYTLYAKYIN